jgi:hypothetical protein
MGRGCSSEQLSYGGEMIVQQPGEQQPFARSLGPVRSHLLGSERVVQQCDDVRRELIDGVDTLRARGLNERAIS